MHFVLIFAAIAILILGRGSVGIVGAFLLAPIILFMMLKGGGFFFVILLVGFGVVAFIYQVFKRGI